MKTLRVSMLSLISLAIAACGGGGGGGGSPPPPPADTTPPQTNITGAPATLTNASDASFSFTSTEAGSTFECSLDGAGFTACTSPQDYAGLAEGSHSFSVRATDAAGNTDSSPAEHDWVVDVSPPDTTITSNPSPVSNSPNATFEFTGTEAGVTFECSIDGGAFASCTSPEEYLGLGDGNHTFAVRSIDGAGNTDPTPATFNWAIDTTPPNTTIVSAPPAVTNSTGASFSFTSSEAGSTFECSLDGAAFAACTSPQDYAGLAEGNHSFSVRATDAAGNTDPTPANYGWEIDLTPPETTIISGPDDPTNSTSPIFTFDSSEAPSTFQCSLDGAAYAACASPESYSGLTEGNHTFGVRAIDAAGNVDPSPATYAWEIDLTPPDTTITSGPIDPTNSTDADFEFSSSEPASSFECSIDSGAYVSCTSPNVYSALIEGDHTFDVRATDAAGNTDPTPASFTWTIDLTPPVVMAPAPIEVVAVDMSGAPATEPAIAAFLAGATATDNVDGDISANITNDAPADFPIGITVVTFSVDDAAGNTGTATSTVEIIPIDMDAPDTTSITINDNAVYAVSLAELTARLIAMDNVGVTDYLITEHNSTDPMNPIPPYPTPDPMDPGWVSVPETDILDITLQVPLTQTYNLGDTVELCAWFMDEQENISARVCDSIIYGDDWESGIGNWSADNGVWQVGTPTAGPIACFSGTDCAGTVLDGNYPASTDSRLISPGYILPTVSGSEELHLRFQQWSSYGGNDLGQVQVSVWDDNTMTWGTWINEGDRIEDASGGWSLKDVDLTVYAGERIRLGFLHVADGSTISVSTGWYLDDITIVRTTPTLEGGFEAGWSGWGAGNGVWQVGTPMAGPSGCFSGVQCAGTVLDGNYPAQTDSRLVSSTLVLPTVSGSDEVHLRFQQWSSYGGNDLGQVQISVWDDNTMTWGSWVNEGDRVEDASGGWSLKDVDLTAYAGETVRIGFVHVADGSTISVSTGWYIDDVTIVQTTPALLGDFESGWTSWGAGNGVWQIGAPAAGPGSCFAGLSCAGTVLNGNYPAATDSRLVSATLTLPVVTAPTEIRLRFQNWFSYGGNDRGQVQVSVWDAATSTWGAWVNEGTPVQNASGGWTLKDVDLTAYSGETIRVGFLHLADFSTISVSSGWYIDDVSVSTF